MPTPPAQPSKTKVIVDLSAHLTPEELAAFEDAAKQAGRTISEHFIAVMLALPESGSDPTTN